MNAIVEFCIEQVHMKLMELENTAVEKQCKMEFPFLTVPISIKALNPMQF